MIDYKVETPSNEMKPSILAASCLCKAAIQVWNSKAKIYEMKQEWTYQHAFYTKIST